MATAPRHVHLLVIPFPGPGHMLPLLDLTHHLSSRFGLAVTIVVTHKNLHHLSSLLERSPSVSPLVLPFPADPLLPPGAENAQEASSIDIRILIRAFAGLHDPLLNWARSRSRSDDPPTAVLSDFFCGWTHQLAADLGVPRLVFCPSGAFCLCILHSLWHRMPQRNDPNDSDEPIFFTDIPRSPFFPWREISPNYRYLVEGDPVSEFAKKGYLANPRSWGFVFNTFRELEKTYLVHLRANLGHERVWAVGPLSSPEAGIGRSGRSSLAAEEEVAAWLRGFAEGSVVYVAFGSLWTLSPTQAQVLEAGLERSGARFLWATRGEVPLSEGFVERVKGRGLILQGWAPQVAILNHPSVGVFLTHCGWNSVLEAVTAGVALLTWPMTADQFFNARLLEEEVGTGVRVCKGGEAIPDPDELARLVSESVGEAGRTRREKAQELGRKAAEALAEGGGSADDLAEMVDKLSKAVIN